MTFGVSRDQGLFEWSGTSLKAVFAQPSNFFQPRMWRMLFDVVRFNQFAVDLLSEKDESEEDPSGAAGTNAGYQKPWQQQSVGDYLDQERYSQVFRDEYLIPMTACVWSTSPDKCSLEFPVITLVRFMWNHHLLNTIFARPPWKTIPGGSQQYIDAVMAEFPENQIHLNTVIESLTLHDDNRVALQCNNGIENVYDHVILATHGDQAMQLIRNVATNEEKDIMSAFKTSSNTAVLHSDLSVSIAFIRL